MNHSLPELNLFFGAHGRGVISSLSCVSWRFHYYWTPLPHVSYQSPSGAWGVAIALEGFLRSLSFSLSCARRAVLVWLPWRRVSGGEEKIFHRKNLYFCEGTSWSFFQGLWVVV